MENVSFGVDWSSFWGDIVLDDGSCVEFIHNKLKNATRIDERNLIHCKYLNLCGAVCLEDIDLHYLGNL